MKKVKILKNTVANNKRVKVGDVVEVSDAAAHYLKAAGRAEEYNEPVKKKVTKKTYTRKVDESDD